MNKQPGRWILGLFFVAAGVNHFRQTAFYVGIVPPWLPAPLLLVQISGVAEIVLGAASLFERTRRGAAVGLIALLLAVFPANVQMALHPARFPEFSPLLLWIRLPLQFVLIGWAWRYARPAAPRPLSRPR